MIHFYKYQGAGNDFIIIDNRIQNLQLSKQDISFLCHRRFGIGADGLMLLEVAKDYDFRMIYYNADGGESSMCGNGGRCITAFAKQLGLITDKAFFTAIDGEHYGYYLADGNIALKMNDVFDVHHFDNYSVLNTGSPHYVLWHDDVDNVDVLHQGKEIRTRDKFGPNGINVNFAQQKNDDLYVRTYERGVEDETLSCGTGVTACAIAFTKENLGDFETNIITKGGRLSVSFTKDSKNSAINVVLTGPATFVFEGNI